MKKNYALSVALATLMYTSAVLAQSQGPLSPSQGISIPLPTGSPWTNPTNCLTSNNMYASANLVSNPMCTGPNCYYSVPLVASGFGFTIPGTATINGIMVEIQRLSSVTATVDSTVRIIKAGAPVGPNKANPNPWPTVNTYLSYGSATDLWGTTWIPSDINAANFGIMLRAFNSSASLMPNAQVDHFRITVYYTVATGSYAVSSTIGEMLNVYSPSHGIMEISYALGTAKTANLSVMNILGETVFSKEISTADKMEQVNTENFVPGVYFVKISSPEKEVTKKVFIQ